jgi:hypothetical protein
MCWLAVASGIIQRPGGGPPKVVFLAVATRAFFEIRLVLSLLWSGLLGLERPWPEDGRLVQKTVEQP